VHVESVAWVGKKDLLCCSFCKHRVNVGSRRSAIKSGVSCPVVRRQATQEGQVKEFLSSNYMGTLFFILALLSKPTRQSPHRTAASDWFPFNKICR
jgi:hypothetical protein